MTIYSLYCCLMGSILSTLAFVALNRARLYTDFSPVFQVFLSRSEEHTSELQSRPHLVCRPLLEKKNHSARKSPLSICVTYPRVSTSVQNMALSAYPLRLFSSTRSATYASTRASFVLNLHPAVPD